MKISKNEKEERALRFNISLATYYNWEKTKPELIKIIELGIQKEKEIFENKNDIHDINNIIEKLKEDVKEIKKDIETIKK